MEAQVTKYDLTTMGRIARHGAQRAAESLGQFSGNALTVGSIDVRIAGIEEIPELGGDPQEVVVGIDFTIAPETEVNGKVLFDETLGGYLLAFFHQRDAELLIEAMLGTPLGSMHELGELELSVLGEAGNIIVSSFLSALDTLCGATILPSPPAVAVDMCAAILTSAFLPVVELGGEVLLIETEIIPTAREQQEVASCRVFFLPKPALWQLLLDAFKPDTATTAVGGA